MKYSNIGPLKDLNGELKATDGVSSNSTGGVIMLLVGVGIGIVATYFILQNNMNDMKDKVAH